MKSAGRSTSAAKEVHHEVAQTMLHRPPPPWRAGGVRSATLLRTGQKSADEFRSARPEILRGRHTTRKFSQGRLPANLNRAPVGVLAQAEPIAATTL